MKTIRRLLFRDILFSVGFVTVAFLALLFFFDFVDQLGRIGRDGYTVAHAVLACLLEIPGHFYELFPITVLIGTIVSLSRMAQSSEFVILRTAGLGPFRALGLLTLLGAAMAVLTFAAGDLVAPWAEQRAVALQASVSGGRDLGGTGAWLRDRREGPEGLRQVSVNVRRVSLDGELQEVKIFEFDARGHLSRRLQADAARVREDGHWVLRNASWTGWPEPGRDIRGNPADGPLAAGPTRVDKGRATELVWPSQLPVDVVSAAILPVATMTTLELWRYSRHLTRQDQAVQRYAIAFWKKALYPLACFVMLGLALPFAYLHARGGGISWKVFGGIMLGISFVLANNLSGHLGVLQNWTPWLAAAMPSLLYLALSLGAFAWLVRYR